MLTRRLHRRRIPSFLYAMPFSKTHIFLEETSLVAKPAVPYQELKQRLEVLSAAHAVVCAGALLSGNCPPQPSGCSSRATVNACLTLLC